MWQPTVYGPGSKDMVAAGETRTIIVVNLAPKLTHLVVMCGRVHPDAAGLLPVGRRYRDLLARPARRQRQLVRIIALCLPSRNLCCAHSIVCVAFLDRRVSASEGWCALPCFRFAPQSDAHRLDCDLISLFYRGIALIFLTVLSLVFVATMTVGIWHFRTHYVRTESELARGALRRVVVGPRRFRCAAHQRVARCL